MLRLLMLVVQDGVMLAGTPAALYYLTVLPPCSPWHHVHCSPDLQAVSNPVSSLEAHGVLQGAAVTPLLSALQRPLGGSAHARHCQLV